MEKLLFIERKNKFMYGDKFTRIRGNLFFSTYINFSFHVSK